LLSIDDNGHVYTLINRRGHASGLVPAWLDAGLTHNYADLGISNANQVKFGKIFGSKSSAGQYMADYTTVTTTGAISAWENTGYGGTRLKGDGVRYCDMLGHKYDDYVSLDYDGSLTLFGNIYSPSTWKDHGKIHPGGIAPRERVYLTDIDGDGKCDYVVVDENDGTVQWMQNMGLNQTFQWGPLISASKQDDRHPTPLNCEWGRKGVRFADTTGNGE
jgi:hypothetical protein